LTWPTAAPATRATYATWASSPTTTAAILREQLTEERVKEHFGPLVTGPVRRYEMPNIRALNFVLNGGLNGGGTQSLRSDALGKVMYAWLLRMELDVAHD
jgi:hypothetical protein